MRHLSDTAFAPVLGWIILSLVVLHTLGTEPFSTESGHLGTELAPSSVPKWPQIVEKGSVPLGLLAGVTTMLANAGGPVLTLYLLGMKVPKLELTATIAWFFFALNLFKVPFSAGLGLITPGTLALNAVLVPGIAIGLLFGRWLDSARAAEIVQPVAAGVRGARGAQAHRRCSRPEGSRLRPRQRLTHAQDAISLQKSLALGNELRSPGPPC